MNARSGVVAALILALLLAVALLVVSGSDPLRALGAFFVDPLINSYYLGNMLSSAGLLLLAAIGVSLSFRAGMFNIGGEGQAYLGVVVCALLALQLRDSPSIVGRILLLIASGAAAGLLAAISGVLRARVGLPELITTFLLSAAIMPGIDAVIIGPARDQTQNLLATTTIDRSLNLPRLLPPSELTSSAVLAVVIAAVAYLLLFHSRRGYELRIVGDNAEFARFSGITVGPTQTISIALSGFLHGVAGAALVLGTHHAALLSGSAGLGWNAIAVALIGRLHPLLCIPAALGVAYLDAGSKASMLHTELTFELVAILQAAILFLVTARIALPRARPPRREQSR